MSLFSNEPKFESPLKDSDVVIHQGVPTPPVESKPVSTLPPKLSASEAIALAESGQLKAKLAVVLDRARTTQRMHVPLPSHLHGEWVKDDPVEIATKQALGFEIDREHAINRGFNGSADGAVRVSDVVFMTAPREVKQALDEIYMQDMRNRHDKRKGGHHKEEEDFAKLTAKDTEGVIPTTIESYTTDATPNSIMDAIRASNDQLP